MPLVSVVMPVFNAAGTVEEAVQSMLDQTYAHLEILVVDDGSSDGSADVVARLRDPRVRLLRRDHRGLVATLNDGCEQAQGEYVARLDGDDTSRPGRIEKQVECLRAYPDVGLVGTWAEIIEGGARGLFTPPESAQALRRYLLRDNPFVHSSVMFRRSVFREAGGYPHGLAEDYRLWIRVARSWRIAMLPEVLVTHHIHAASYTRRQPRTAALRGRLAGQWQAARMLGPWPAAAVALAVSSGAYGLALLGGPLEEAVRRRLRARLRRTRGFLDPRRGDRPR
jgi:glycosyltransferase involved in cell wall biosynthesis